MTKLNLKLETINDVKEFVNAVTMCDYDVDLVSGRYSIDAKSRPVELQAHVDNCDDLIAKIDRFIVK